MQSLKKWLLPLSVLLWAGEAAHGQSKGYENYERQGGVLIKSKPIPGFKAWEVFEIFNTIDVVNKPEGYDVREGASYRFDEETKVYRGFHSIGFPRLYRFQGKIERQQEFYHAYVYTNDLEYLYSVYDAVFSEEADRLNFPRFITDTFRIEYQQLNGTRVGKIRFKSEKQCFVLNPRQTPVFVPVKKEELIKLWIGKLGLEINKTEERIKEFRGYVRQYTGQDGMNEQINGYRREIGLAERWLAYYRERKTFYESKQNSLSPAEKRETALTAVPHTNVGRVNWYQREGKIAGYMPGELADFVDAESSRPLFHLNPAFFDTRQPKTTQIMVIEGNEPAFNEPSFIQKLENGLYPRINFKLLRDLMIK